MSIVYDYGDIGAQMKGDTWWQAEKPAAEPALTIAEIEAMVRPPLVAKPLEIKAGHICSVKLPDGSRWPTFDAVERAAKSLRSSSWLRH